MLASQPGFVLNDRKGGAAGCGFGGGSGRIGGGDGCLREALPATPCGASSATLLDALACVVPTARWASCAAWMAVAGAFCGFRNASALATHNVPVSVTTKPVIWPERRLAPV
jgi:hypothetical protein